MEMNGDLPEDNFNEDEEDFEGDTVPDIRGLKVVQPNYWTHEKRLLEFATWKNGRCASVVDTTIVLHYTIWSC